LIRQGIFCPENIDYLNNIETALLISLCSSNLNISKVAVSLFQQLHEMSVLAVEVCGDELTTMKPHFEMYDRLSSISLVVSSRLAIQKAFRKALSQIRQPTFSITAALGTAFEERDRLSKHLNTPMGTRKLVGTRLMEADMITTDWINYSGFLASLGGCWYADARGKEPGEVRPRSVSLTKSEIDSKNQLKMFLKDQCRYLASESGILRETVSRMLSTDLSPRLFGLLFEQLDDITSNLFDTKGQPVCKDNNTLFVDQAVMLLKGLVDRITEPVDIPPYVDFGGILSSFCEYLERLGRDPVKLQIKVKMCMLCELVAAKRDVLNLKQEARLMNNLLDHIYQWASESETSKTDVIAMPEGERNLQKYALRSMANITAQLPLLVSSEPDNDPSEAKAKMFRKYFDYLANVLKRCRVLDGFEPDQRTLNVNKNLQTILLKSKENLKDLAPLRELTMTTISNLVNANVDAGLPYCLPMAYTEDTRTKTSFLQLFTKMLEQRVDLDDLDDALPLDRIERIMEVFSFGGCTKSRYLPRIRVSASLSRQLALRIMSMLCLLLFFICMMRVG
jgi:neurofibromin 1